MECPDCKGCVCFECGNCDCGELLEWIDIKDKKPPENEWVLGANFKRIEMGVWLGDKKAFTLPHFNYLCLEITHWMPLPEPPKEEECILKREWKSKEEVMDMFPKEKKKSMIERIKYEKRKVK